MAILNSIESLKLKIVSVRDSIDGTITTGFPPISETDLLLFERKHRIVFPEEYRCFVSEVCNGGAELFKLGEMDDGFDIKPWTENDGFVGILTQPFPFTDSWNDLSNLPHYDEERANDQEWLSKFDAMRKIFESEYFLAIDGAIPIAHIGCAIRHWLVITGDERGHVWEDDRANQNGFYPILGSDDHRITFLAWFLEQHS